MVMYNTYKQNAYYDSVTLMLFSSKLASVEGIKDAAVMMGTDHNKSLMMKSGILTEELARSITPNDLVIGIRGEGDDHIQQALKVLEEQFENKRQSVAGDERIRAKTLESAVKQLGNPNFAVISLPGKFAGDEAMKAMKNGMHVLLFSDNVSIEEENRLKDYAVEHQLLMMGPDCGTAIVNGAALGFANVVPQGNIGVVAAAGTGLQEVSVLIGRMGGGISQALGTGGRDVKEEVGGKMMLLALNALNNDPQTQVIGIVSKPPSPSVMQRILNLIQNFQKPVVACFLGGDEKLVAGAGVVAAETLREAAAYLVDLSQGRQPQKLSDEDVDGIVAGERAKYAASQRYVRGLYSGGSLCYESMLLLEKEIGGIYSNIAHGEYELKDVESSKGNTLIDMGDDYFTDGMPHPMIDPRLRAERIKREAQDDSVAVMLLDCVLGYGAHENPAGAITDAIHAARGSGKNYITYIVSVCGTDADRQNRGSQEKILRDAGAIVMPSNQQAALLAAKILKQKAE